MKLQSLTILGSTGSIGQSTLDVVLRHPDRFRVHALSANQRVDVLLEQSRLVRPDCVVLPDDQTAQRFKNLLGPADHHPEVRVGTHALSQTAADSQTDVVMAAIVGIAGLPAAIAAANAGKRILLANKEALVAAGSLFMAAVRHHQAELLPIDSEHNAIFQCLPHTSRASAPTGPAPGVARILLTASGGPFRQTPLAELTHVTPAQACAHPNWRMGRKISVDSATMLNKGLEVIEAHWLFAMPSTRIDVVIHPQSVVHSMVQYDDGSVLAQLGQPDMRTPIAYGLGFPERIAAGVSMLDLVQVGKLDFEAVDTQRYPCLNLAYEALAAGQASCIALNAANELAVQAFLDGLIAYRDIVSWIREALNWQAGQSSASVESLDDVLAIDQACRTFLNARCLK
jgi:1-deoxy-D-xylulose-5-phosphate reductoisomerase